MIAWPRAVSVVGLGLVLTVAPGPWAGPGPGGAAPRERSLSALGDRTNVEGRREAARDLGQTGTMADIPALVQALRDPDAAVRTLAEQSMWQVWSRSGDADTDRLFASALEQMSLRQGEAAIETFSEVIARRPDFAEGWNKRATIYYLLGDYQRSLADCDEVMKRNPYHFGALSGYGMIYLQLDQPDRALEYFERALRVNPNLQSVEEAVESIKTMLLQRRRNTL